MLKEYSTIHDGIGLPDFYLTLCLMAAWIFIVVVLINGVQSSGKASYFLALFPYVIMLILLIRAVTLPGALNGILYFIRPQWDKLFDANVSRIRLMLAISTPRKNVKFLSRHIKLKLVLFPFDRFFVVRRKSVIFFSPFLISSDAVIGLVCGHHSMLLFVGRLFWQFNHVRIVQSFQS